jgi:hypothetical protein
LGDFFAGGFFTAFFSTFLSGFLGGDFEAAFDSGAVFFVFSLSSWNSGWRTGVGLISGVGSLMGFSGFDMKI